MLLALNQLRPVYACKADKACHQGVCFMLCNVCFILAFKVYVGKEDDSDGTAVGVCDQLVNDAGFTSARGRVLYTDNYYTSVKLAKHMYENYD